MALQRPIPSLDLPRKAVALVLAGGRGKRLMHLTNRRAKPAVYFGGKFRIIDFALSNCLNSGIRRVAVITQYKSHSLLRHLQRGWKFLQPELNEFVDFLPAQQRMDHDLWYRGTADAVYQNEDILASVSYRAEYIVVLAGDHVYKMNYAQMLADHIALGAECTVGCVEVPRMEATGFGVIAIDESRRVVDFVEKPADPPAMPGKPDRALASMGIYVFKASFLFRELEREMADPSSSHDFGRDMIPRLVKMGVVAAHPLDLSCVGQREGQEPYWRDVGTVDAYWDANIDLTATDPVFDMYNTEWPIWTYQQQLPPAKFVHNYGNRQGMALESLVSSGCIISGHIEQSMLFWSVRVHSYSNVTSSVILPGVQVGRHARVHKAVVDRAAVIPDGMVIGEDPAADAARFYRTDAGVTLVTREMLRALA